MSLVVKSPLFFSNIQTSFPKKVNKKFLVYKEVTNILYWLYNLSLDFVTSKGSCSSSLHPISDHEFYCPALWVPCAFVAPTVHSILMELITPPSSLHPWHCPPHLPFYCEYPYPSCHIVKSTKTLKLEDLLLLFLL